MSSLFTPYVLFENNKLSGNGINAEKGRVLNWLQTSLFDRESLFTVYDARDKFPET